MSSGTTTTTAAARRRGTVSTSDPDLLGAIVSLGRGHTGLDPAPAPVTGRRRPPAAAGRHVRRTAGRRVGSAPLRRWGLVVAFLVAALPLSLWDLVEAWRYQTPVGVIAVVPLTTVVLVVITLRRHTYVARLPRTRVDSLAALPLLGAAALLIWVAPSAWPVGYWAARLDLLAFPLLLTAGICLVLGLGVLFVLRLAVLYSLAVWTLPWAALLEILDGPLTAATSWAVRQVVPLGGLATVVPDEAGLTLQVPPTEGGLLLTVASACSGANSLLGYLAVGGAATLLVQGPVRRRATWLLSGLAAVWVLNVLRITMIAWVAAVGGESAALQVFHPVGGLVVVNLVFAVALARMPRWGLTWGPDTLPPPDTPLVRPSARPARSTFWSLRWRLAVLGIATAVLLAGQVRMGGLVRPLPSDVSPRLTTAEALHTRPVWQAAFVGDQRWAEPYFGAGSSWDRFRLRAGSRHPFSVWVDSVSTPSLSALLSRPVQECYRLHGYDLVVDRPVSLADGLRGAEVVYRRADGEVWHAVTWQWRAPDGRGYQRLTLLASFLAPTGSAGASHEAVLQELVATARELVSAQQGIPATTSL